MRAVPTVSWLESARPYVDRISADRTARSRSRHTSVPASGATPASYVAATSTKTAIYHADAERDEYFSPRFFALGQTAFDHNFSQDLDLQQIYGGGIGWTALKTPKQELDLKATMQYEKQQFHQRGSRDQSESDRLDLFRELYVCT